MLYNRKKLKADARGLITKGGFDLLWKTALFLIILATVTQLSSRVSGADVYAERVANALQELGENAASMSEDEVVQQFTETVSNIPKMTVTASLIVFLLSLVTSFLNAGFRWWCLLVTRNEQNDFRNMFDGFNFPLRLFLLHLIKGAVIIAGLLLFLIPGIVLSFSYSQAMLIMFEDPTKGPIQCMRESRQLMTGNKGKYFMLLLSFFGWGITAYFISNTIGGLLTTFGLTVLVPYSGVIFGTWFSTYTGLTYAGFYNWLTGYVPKEEPVTEQIDTFDEEDDDDDYRF